MPEEMTDSQKIDVLMDHLVTVTDQLQRLKGFLEHQNIRAPADLGRFGPTLMEAYARIIEEGHAELDRIVAKGELEKYGITAVAPTPWQGG